MDTKKLLKKNWRVCFKKRLGICFRKRKRVSSLTPNERAAAVNSFVTYLRAVGHIWKVALFDREDGNVDSDVDSDLEEHQPWTVSKGVGDYKPHPHPYTPSHPCTP